MELCDQNSLEAQFLSADCAQKNSDFESGIFAMNDPIYKKLKEHQISDEEC